MLGPKPKFRAGDLEIEGNFLLVDLVQIIGKNGWELWTVLDPETGNLRPLLMVTYRPKWIYRLGDRVCV